MSEPIDRYLAIDEDGYFVFDQARVTEPDIGRPLLEAMTAAEGGRFTTEMKGQKAWIEAFDEPLIARHVQALNSTTGQIDLCYGAKANFAYASLCVDEWDRFHGVTDKGLPFVFSRPAQVEFFELLEEFDDDSITVAGQSIPTPSWLNPSPETSNDTFWSQLYKSETTGWELGRESVVLPNVLPQLKLNRCRVLVLGCGSGHDAAYFAQQGHVVTAVDFSSEAIQRVKQNYGSLENLKIVQSDAFQLPAEWNERFDLVFEHTFYCAVSPDRRNDVVKVWRRVLAPQGHLLGVFFAMEKRTGPPFGGSEREIRERIKGTFDLMFWTRWRHSVEERKARELVVFARKKAL